MFLVPLRNMANWKNGPDIRAALDQAVSRLGVHAPAADVEREAEKILSAEWHGMYGSLESRTPCRLTADVCVASCASRLQNTVRALLYEQARRTGSSLEAIVSLWSEKPSPRPRLHLRLPDSDVLSAGHDQGIESILVHALDRAALDAGIDMVEGPVFTLANDRGLRLLESLPDLLRHTHAVRPVLEIDDSETDFLKDALYAVALSLLGPGKGTHGIELAIRTSSSHRRTSYVETPSIDVTVPAGSGADLTHAGREAYLVGRTALEHLVAASAGGPETFRGGAVQIALSAEHSGDIPHRNTAGNVRDALLAGIPRGARTEVVVDGYPLGLTPRNRISLTPDTNPEDLAVDIGSRLRVQLGHAPSTILLSTPAVTR